MECDEIVARLHDVAHVTKERADRVSGEAPGFIVDALRDDAQFLGEAADFVQWQHDLLRLVQTSWDEMPDEIATRIGNTLGAS
jgi:hypothetical protein